MNSWGKKEPSIGYCFFFFWVGQLRYLASILLKFNTNRISSWDLMNSVIWMVASSNKPRSAHIKTGSLLFHSVQLFVALAAAIIVSAAGAVMFYFMQC